MLNSETQYVIGCNYICPTDFNIMPVDVIIIKSVSKNTIWHAQKKLHKCIFYTYTYIYIYTQTHTSMDATLHIYCRNIKSSKRLENRIANHLLCLNWSWIAHRLFIQYRSHDYDSCLVAFYFWFLYRCSTIIPNMSHKEFIELIQSIKLTADCILYIHNN